VDLKLEPGDWFSLEGAGERGVSVGAGQIGAAQFTIVAEKIGKFKLALSGRMKGGSQREDQVVREIEVVPNGEAKEIVFSGRLDSSARHTVRFPETSIPDASKIFVRLYPGPLSQVIEGMDSILRMPYGCFEQTSSATYPNVLALDYMKRTKKLTPEIHAKAEGFVGTGYQRLLTFEVAGGGFSWFGNAPANKILTSYGLMEAGGRTRSSSTKARRTVSIRMRCASPHTSRGRSSRPITKDRRLRRPGNLSRSISTARWTHTRWLWLRTSQ